jgi:hypothetical protein
VVGEWILTSFNKSTPWQNEMEGIRPQSKLGVPYYTKQLIDLLRFFKRLKLDYPQQETTRASRRFVKAMKKLEVSLHGPILLRPKINDK